MFHTYFKTIDYFTLSFQGCFNSVLTRKLYHKTRVKTQIERIKHIVNVKMFTHLDNVL